MTEPTKRPPGRPPIPPEDALRVGTIRLTAAQWAKLKLLGGGEWIRARIDRARLTKKGE